MGLARKARGNVQKTFQLNITTFFYFFREAVQKALPMPLYDPNYAEGKNMSIYWIYLFIAIALDVVGTIFLKYADGFTKVLPSSIVIISYALSLYLFTIVVQKIEIGTAYAVWSGLGTVFVVGLGVYLFEEHIDWTKAGYIALVLIGVMGLNLSEG